VEALLLLRRLVEVRLLSSKKRRKRRRKKRLVRCHDLCFYDLVYIYFLQEESDDDMGFGLFD